MCRYASKKYKPHFVCFDCRKQFKRPPLEDVLAQHGNLEMYKRLLLARTYPTRQSEAKRAAGVTAESMERDYRDLVSKCPQCGSEMADLGYDFKPPRSTATRAWERLHGMYRIGRTWHTCGCNGPGYIPTSETDYAAHLRGCIGTFTERLRNVQADSALEPALRKEQVQYWTTRIQKVQAELARSGTRAGRRRAGAA